MSRAGCAVLLALLAGFAGTPAFCAPAAALSISVPAGTPAQGDPLVVDVAATGPLDNLVLVWKGTAWPLREIAPGRYEGLVGVDLLATPGPETLVTDALRRGTGLR